MKKYIFFFVFICLIACEKTVMDETVLTKTPYQGDKEKNDEEDSFIITVDSTTIVFKDSLKINV